MKSGHTRSLPSMLAAVTALVALTACSGSGDGDAGAPSSSSADLGSTAPATSEAQPQAPATTPAEPVDDAGTAPTTVEPEPTTTLVDVPETGVPGLDSDDAFCAAWSRFGGSWQVIAVASAFLDDPVAVAEYEVMAATIVGPAYDDLLANLPDELIGEADAVADGYFGPFARRSGDAVSALADAGVTDDQLDEITEAWLAALAVRDPSSPGLAIDLSDDARAALEDAVVEFGARRVGFAADPSLVIIVETPLTDEYLVTACPDQGSLAGLEIDG